MCQVTQLGFAMGPSNSARTGWEGRALRLGQTWVVAAWEIAHLGSCHLGKYPWEVSAWENGLGKISGVCIFKKLPGGRGNHF